MTYGISQPRATPYKSGPCDSLQCMTNSPSPGTDITMSTPPSEVPSTMPAVVSPKFTWGPNELTSFTYRPMGGGNKQPCGWYSSLQSLLNYWSLSAKALTTIIIVPSSKLKDFLWMSSKYGHKNAFHYAGDISAKHTYMHSCVHVRACTHIFSTLDSQVFTMTQKHKSIAFTTTWISNTNCKQ